MGAGDPNRQPVVNVVLEALRVEHADEMLSVLADPALYEFTGGEPPNRAALAARYEAQVRGSGRPGERWCNWIIRRVDTGEAAGFVQATVIDGVADLAWLAGLHHQRRGIAVQAVKAMIDELASSGVTQFTAHVRPGHHRSQRVASAAGLRPTGELDDDGEEVWTNVAR
ncbi:MAG: GNAT family N-acetyltransferase [Actinomycetota bacterium]